MPDMVTAVDDMLFQFKVAWDAQSPPYGPGGGLPVDVRYPNVDTGSEPDQAYPWARVIVQHVNGDQYSLGVPGNRLWEHEGLFVVQIYVPVGRGLKAARALATIGCAGHRKGDPGPHPRPPEHDPRGSDAWDRRGRLVHDQLVPNVREGSTCPRSRDSDRPGLA